MTDTKAPRLISMNAVTERTALSRATVYRLMLAGGFPRPVKLHGAKRMAFVEHEVDGWIAARIAARDTQAA